MVIDDIIDSVLQKKNLFVVLIDPEKVSDIWLEGLLEHGERAPVDMYFVGGSTYSGDISPIIKFIKERTRKPVILFPGGVAQLNDHVDAVLLLSLISGRNPEYLIGSHVKVAHELVKHEVISVGYVLIDGGRRSSVQTVTNTTPLDPENINEIVATAIASELLGHKMVYLEAGSGAKNHVPLPVIQAVRSAVSLPLIVGGGIRDRHEVNSIYKAGANLVVVGNVLESSYSMLKKT